VLGSFLGGGVLVPYVSFDIRWGGGGGRAIEIADFGVWQC